MHCVVMVSFSVFGSVSWCCCQSMPSFCVTSVQLCPSPLIQLSAQKGVTCATMEGSAVGTHRPVSAHLDMEEIFVRRSSLMPLVSLEPRCDSNKWVLQCYVNTYFPYNMHCYCGHVMSAFSCNHNLSLNRFCNAPSIRRFPSMWEWW